MERIERGGLDPCVGAALGLFGLVVVALSVGYPLTGHKTVSYVWPVRGQAMGRE